MPVPKREKELQAEVDALKQVLQDLQMDRGASRETVEMIETLQGTDGELKRKLAEGILWRVYRNWIDREVDDLIRGVVDGEINNTEDLQQTMEENTDGSLIYTHDQRMVLFVSESVDEGMQAMEDMGGGGDNPTGVAALLTYQTDVIGRLEHLGLWGDFDREEWLEAARAGEHGDEIQALAKR